MATSPCGARAWPAPPGCDGLAAASPAHSRRRSCSASSTVRENIAVGRTTAGDDPEATETCERLIGQLGLGDLAREVVSGLPYGLQRRVEIARALAGCPSVLLLDEPAAGLNDSETAALRDLLGDVRRGLGCSILVIDHDMNLVLEVSDRVQVLDEGRVIYSGDPQEAFRQPHVVEAYLGAEE